MTPLSGTTEVVPVVNRDPPRGFAPRSARRYTKPRGGSLLTTGATGPQARPAADQERFLKRQLSLPVSMISQ